MFQRSRSTFFLVLVFVALFAYFWFYQKDQKPKEEDTGPKYESVKLVDTAVADIKTIKWNTATYSGELTREGEGWKMITPSGIQVDSEKTQSFITSITNFTGDQKISTNELSLQDAGLDKPRATVTITNKDGKAEVVKIGKRAFDESYFYAQKEGSNDITLLSSFTIEELEKDPTELKSVPVAPSPLPMGSITPQQ
jgi:hypothetical protein